MAKLLKSGGTALVSVLIIVAALAAFTGVLKEVWPASQLSPTAQYVIDPYEDVKTFPFTTLRELKNKRTKLEITKATVNIVDKEVKEKLGGGEATYSRLIGTASKPGVLGLGLFSLLGAFGTRLYDKSKMYSAEEVELIKEGKTIL